MNTTYYVPSDAHVDTLNGHVCYDSVTRLYFVFRFTNNQSWHVSTWKCTGWDFTGNAYSGKGTLHNSD